MRQRTHGIYNKRVKKKTNDKVKISKLIITSNTIKSYCSPLHCDISDTQMKSDSRSGQLID